MWRSFHNMFWLKAFNWFWEMQKKLEDFIINFVPVHTLGLFKAGSSKYYWWWAAKGTSISCHFKHLYSFEKRKKCQFWHESYLVLSFRLWVKYTEYNRIKYLYLFTTRAVQRMQIWVTCWVITPRSDFVI